MSFTRRPQNKNSAWPKKNNFSALRRFTLVGTRDFTLVGARGFTLVEVLVAVAIVALAITGVLTAMMRQVDSTAYLRDKLFAHYVALNQMELLLLTNAHSNQLPSDTASGSEDMVGQTWYWRATPKKTGQAGTVQAEITVADKEDKDASPLATISVILDTFHRLPQ